MSDRPNFKLHRNPRFSANQLADYMLANTASQRETIMRAAKFPRTTAVVPYTASRRIITDFLPSHEKGFDRLDGHVERLVTQLRREPDGWNQDELKRNIEALDAFKQAFKKRRLRAVKFTSGPTDLTMNTDGVRINTRIDVGVLEQDDDGSAFGGGVTLAFASSAPTRKNIDERGKIVAALIHWNLQEIGGNVEPIERLCMSFDVFGNAIIKAPTAIDRLRANVRSSCREAASNWAGVEPPPSYDGPDWE